MANKIETLVTWFENTKLALDYTYCTIAHDSYSIKKLLRCNDDISCAECPFAIRQRSQLIDELSKNNNEQIHKDP